MNDHKHGEGGSILKFTKQQKFPQISNSTRWRLYSSHWNDI